MKAPDGRNRYLAVVPARGGSKRIPGKNLTSLGGRPLLDYTARAIKDSRCLTAALLSTDDEAIERYGHGLQMMLLGLRPAELATDTSSLIGALQHALATYEANHAGVDAVVVLQPTSPFRTGTLIDEAIALYESSGADTLTAVHAARDHPYWIWRRTGQWIEPFVSYEAMTTDRSALPAAYAECGALYIVRRDLIAIGDFYGARVIPFPVDSATAVDIDTPDDVVWAEFLLARGLAPRLDAI